MSDFQVHWKDKGKICPICGHKGWCASTEAENGQTVWMCHRKLEINKGDQIIGTDGVDYICPGRTKKDDLPILEPKELYMLRRPTSQIARDSNYVPTVMTATIQKKEKEKVIEPFPNDVLDVMMRYFLRNCGLKLIPKHREQLHREGMTDEMISKFMIVSYPERDAVRFKHPNLCDSTLPKRIYIGKQMSERFGDLTRFPNAYRNSKGVWTFGGQGGIIFPLFDIHNRIIGLRLKPDHRWSDENWEFVSKEEYDAHEKECDEQGIESKWHESGKYLNFASSSFGPSMGIRIGVYSPTLPFTPAFIYVTEGEKKAIISADYLKAYVLSVPGVNNWPKLFENDDKGESIVDHFRREGCSVFAVAYDADKETNGAVKSQQDMLVEKLQQAGFDVCLCDWNIANGKGLDDLLVNGFLPQRHFV